MFQEMFQKTREDHTGVQLEVNERILDACTDLMKVNDKTDYRAEMLVSLLLLLIICSDVHQTN